MAHDYLNKRPVFLNCLARGGSNLLVNLLISHPYVCISSGETHKVFKPGTPFDAGWLRIKKRFAYDYALRAMIGEDYFDAHRLQPRRRTVGPRARRYIDKLLYEGRFLARIETHNLYQFEDVPYTDDELAKCRLLTKGLDGMVFTVPLFREMYPDAVFLAMVRNGLAVCEGRSRRGRSVARYANEYRVIVEEMLRLRDSMPNYHLLRFEDMVSRPVEFTREVYHLAGIAIDEVPQLRVESKRVMKSDGTHDVVTGPERTLTWCDLEGLRGKFKPDVNDNQIRMLKPDSKETFLSIAGKSMEQLGYPTN